MCYDNQVGESFICLIFYRIGNFVSYTTKTLRVDAYSCEDVICRKRPRSVQEIERK